MVSLLGMSLNNISLCFEGKAQSNQESIIYKDSWSNIVVMLYICDTNTVTHQNYRTAFCIEY